MSNGRLANRCCSRCYLNTNSHTFLLFIQVNMKLVKRHNNIICKSGPPKRCGSYFSKSFRGRAPWPPFRILYQGLCGTLSLNFTPIEFHASCVEGNCDQCVCPHGHTPTVMLMGSDISFHLSTCLFKLSNWRLHKMFFCHFSL